MSLLRCPAQLSGYCRGSFGIIQPVTSDQIEHICTILKAGVSLGTSGRATAAAGGWCCLTTAAYLMQSKSICLTYCLPSFDYVYPEKWKRELGWRKADGWVLGGVGRSCWRFLLGSDSAAVHQRKAQRCPVL